MYLNININKNLAKVEKKFIFCCRHRRRTGTSKCWEALKLTKFFFLFHSLHFTSFTLPLSRTLCQPICCVYVWGAHPNAQTTLFEPKIFAFAMFVILQKFNCKLSANIPHSPWPCLSTALSFFSLPRACQVWPKLQHFPGTKRDKLSLFFVVVDWMACECFIFMAVNI